MLFSSLSRGLEIAQFWLATPVVGNSPLNLDESPFTHLVIFLAKSYKSAHRTPPSNRFGRCVRCTSCDFSGQELQDRYRTPPSNRFGRCVRYASCDFSGQELQKCASHAMRRRSRIDSVDVCDTHLVIFPAKSYKTDIARRHRINSVDVCGQLFA